MTSSSLRHWLPDKCFFSFWRRESQENRDANLQRNSHAQHSSNQRTCTLDQCQDETRHLSSVYIIVSFWYYFVTTLRIVIILSIDSMVLSKIIINGMTFASWKIRPSPSLEMNAHWPYLKQVWWVFPLFLSLRFKVIKTTHLGLGNVQENH